MHTRLISARLDNMSQLASIAADMIEDDRDDLAVETVDRIEQQIWDLSRDCTEFSKRMREAMKAQAEKEAAAAESHGEG
jgi:hypothetical protein